MQAEEKYISGFNNGYTLAKYKPDLIRLLLQNLKLPNQYLYGLFKREKEFE